MESWQNPSWGCSPEYQNGTFPFNRDSTAFALDDFASYLLGCDEGWIHWLKKSGDGTYGPGDIWGCVGSWDAGAWCTKPALDYIVDVRHELRDHAWLDPAWGEFHTSWYFRIRLSAGPSIFVAGGTNTWGRRCANDQKCPVCQFHLA